jgi:Protein of unknown function (DUF3237)
MMVAVKQVLLAIGMTLLVAPAVTAKNPKVSEAAPPKLSFAFEARITLAPVIEQGVVDGKRKRFIAITGGTVQGPRLKGTILPGGGDWQSIHPDGLTEIFARYSIKADDGTVIAITNPGVRVASTDVIARLSAGEDVDPALYYFRTAPVFEVAAGPHAWLRRSVFVGRGIRKPDHVIVQFFSVD